MKWHYTDNGNLKKTMYGQKVARSTDARVPLPCINCPKIPEGKPKTRFQAVDFDGPSWDAYQFNIRCKAIGRFPDDEMVERVAVVLDQVNRECDEVIAARQRVREFMQLALVTGTR